MLPAITDYLKNLVFIDWFRKFQGTKILKSEPPKSEVEKPVKSYSEKDSGFNDK